MLDSEESSSSALSAIALAVSASATSDDNSNDMTTPMSTNVPPPIVHQLQQHQRLSLNSTADTTLDSSVGGNTTVVEDAQQRLLRQSAEKLQALAQAKRTALGSEGGSNSNSPSKRFRNPLTAVTCNNQSEAATPLNFQPSTSRLAQVRQASKPAAAPPPPSLARRFVPAADSFFVYRTPSMSAHISSGINYFDRLSDEILLNIFKWLPKKTLLRMATVSRRFNRCSRDETLWTRLDLGLRTLRPGALEQIVRRGVLVMRLAQITVSLKASVPGRSATDTFVLQIQEPAFTSSPAAFRARLQYLDLSMASISQSSLHTLFSQCRQLKKISLENTELDDNICAEIAKNKSLEAVNLTMASGLTANSVRLMMESLTNLSSLNISWTDLTADAVTALVTHISPNVIRLNIAGCRRVLFDSRKWSLSKLLLCIPVILYILLRCGIFTEAMPPAAGA